MCLIATKGSLQTAENDIVCYKIVIDKKDYWKSAFGVRQNFFPYNVELVEMGLPEEEIRRVVHGHNKDCLAVGSLVLATTKIVVKSPNRDVGRMRVFAKRGTWKVAKKDLGMYTVVHFKNSNFVKIPYYGMNYTTNGIWVADSQLFDCSEPEHLTVKMPNDTLMLGHGFFYSAPNLEMCDEYRKKHGMHNNQYTSEKTIACTIPKDTLYYIGDNGWVASRKIVFCRPMLVQDASQKTINQE